MEVHHHAHDPAIPHHKKNWKSYFWEFLMLFLAVFCGFLAENYREHYVEHQREKKFAIRLYSDLKADTAAFNSIDKAMLKKINLYKIKKDVLLNSNMLSDSSFARTATELWAAFGFISNSTTFSQMKTSGSLRYIRNDSLVEKLSIYYDKGIPSISKSFDFINDKLHDQIEPSFAEHFNIFDLSDSLNWKSANIYINRSKSSDMIIKNRLFLYYFGIRYIYKTPLQNSKVRAIELLKLLKKEYGFE